MHPNLITWSAWLRSLTAVRRLSEVHPWIFAEHVPEPRDRLAEHVPEPRDRLVRRLSGLQPWIFAEHVPEPRDRLTRGRRRAVEGEPGALEIRGRCWLNPGNHCPDAGPPARDLGQAAAAELSGNRGPRKFERGASATPGFTAMEPVHSQH